MEITIATQNGLLETLAKAREDDDNVDFSSCIDASVIGQKRALNVINDYFIRKVEEEKEVIARDTMKVLEHSAVQKQERQVQQAGRPLQAVQRGNTMPNLQRLPSEAAHDTSKSRRFPFLRSTTTVVEPRTSQAMRLAPTLIQSDEASINPLSIRSLSGSTQVSDSSRRTVSRRISASQRQSTSSTNSHLQISPSSTNNITSPNSSRRSTIISEDRNGLPSITSYGGCCKNAHHLRDGKLEKSLKLQTLTTMPGTMNCNFKCPSRKCAFQVPALMNKKHDWLIDKRVRTWNGMLQYTLIFLAKSHVPTLVPLHEQKTRAEYRCIVCILSHETANVFQGHDALLEHVLGHGGATLNGVRLEGPLSFSNDGVSISGDFDINLPEAEPSATTQTTTHEHTSDPVVVDAELQHELEKLEISSRRSSHASQETDPYYCPWD